MIRKLIPWLGGKAAMAARIVRLIPPHVCYVEVFAGGAAVYAAKAPSKIEVLNDKNDGLLNLFRIYQRHPEAFLKELGLVLHSREWYEDCWAQQGLTDIERAARFFYRTLFTFCNKPARKSFKYSAIDTGHGTFDPAAVREHILSIHERLGHTILECLPWEEILRRYDRPSTFFYVDPPYYEGPKLYGPGLDFTHEDHAKLAQALRGLKGPFMVSLNDRREVRALYAWARLRRMIVRYAVGTNTTGHPTTRRPSQELLITNRPWVCR
jgi:DNA adenine methylase